MDMEDVRWVLKTMAYGVLAVLGMLALFKIVLFGAPLIAWAILTVVVFLFGLMVRVIFNDDVS